MRLTHSPIIAPVWVIVITGCDGVAATYRYPGIHVAETVAAVAAGKGEAYFKKMMANKAERAGSFVAPMGEPPDVTLLDAFIKSSLESHLTGRPVAPWLSECDHMMMPSSAAAGEEETAESGGARGKGDGNGSGSSRGGGGEARKAAKARRGIEIPAPTSLDGECGDEDLGGEGGGAFTGR